MNIIAKTFQNFPVFSDHLSKFFYENIFSTHNTKNAGRTKETFSELGHSSSTGLFKIGLNVP